MAELTPKGSGILEEMTLDQVRRFDAQVVVIGIGSTEPHGPHLPYGTDNFVADAFCRESVLGANAAGAKVLMYPTLRLSNNVNFKGFPFSGRIGVRTLMNVVLDIVEALEEDGMRKIVLVNGHGGNEVLPGIVREHTGRQKPNGGAFLGLVHLHGMVPPEVRAIIEKPSDHAGELETSCIMHLRPELVQADKLADFPTHKPTLESLRKHQMQFVRQWHEYVPRSVAGDARRSTAAKGKAFMEAGVREMAKLLLELSQAPWHDSFPFPPSAKA